MSSLTPVTDETFAALVLESPMPVLVDYWADWCSPCKQLTPILEELADQFAGQVTFYSMDTNANTVVPTQQGILGLPTIQLYANGELVNSLQGGKTKMALVKAIEEVL